MPSLVLGPLLRHVGEHDATVWVETDAACTVEVLGHTDLSLEGARLGATGGGARIGELGQLFPRVEAEAPAA